MSLTRGTVRISFVTVLVVLGATLAAVKVQDRAEAFVVPTAGSGRGGCPSASGCIYYQLDASLTAPPISLDVENVVWPTDRAWKINGLTQQAELWNGSSDGSSHVVREANGELAAHILGTATRPCSNTATNCVLRLNIWGSGRDWNTANRNPQLMPDGRWEVDLMSMLTHEFGHFLVVRR